MKTVKLSITVIAILLMGVLVTSGAKADKQSEYKVRFKPNWRSLSQWEMPEWFDDAVLGIYMHWGVYSVPGFVFTDPEERIDSGLWYGAEMYNRENVYGVYEHHLNTYGDPCDFGYKDFVPMFKAENWDPDGWAEFFKSIGTDFAGLAAEHGDGFCLWDTEHDAFNAADMGPKRDLLGDWFEAVRKQGMKTVVTFHKGPGSIYAAHGKDYCPEGVDVNNPEYADLYGPTPRQELNAKLIEVIDKYQPDQMWFEAGAPQAYGKKDYLKFMAYYYNQAQGWGKEVMVTQKSGSLPDECAALDIEGGIFPGGIWEWAGLMEPREDRWQKDVPLGNFWAYAEGVGCRPVNMLVDGIVDRVSKNGATLLNVAPKADGTLPQAQIDGLRELGNWMAINREALYAARPAPFVDGGVDTWAAGTIRFTEKGEYLYAIELGNIWPTKRGFADYEESVLPSAPLKIPGVKPIDGSAIRLLGFNEDLLWHMEGDDLIIEALPDTLPCDHAWSFRIQVK
jgi:alpha-L-fucosidase